MEMPVIMHINCCEQGHTIDDACRKCSELGFDGIELRSKRSGVMEGPISYLDTVSRAVEKNKVKTVLFGSYGLQKLDGTIAEKEQEMEELARFYELASRRFQLFVCNTFVGPLINKNALYSEYAKNGSFIAKEEHWGWAVSCYKVLGELAQKLGFIITFETHMCYLNDTLEATVYLVNRIDNPSVGINLDYGNLIYFENVPLIKDAVSLAGDKLHYVHLKNSIGLPGGGRIKTGLGEGDINNRELLKALKDVGYQGPLCVEVPRNGDREWFAGNDLYYLRKLMEEIH